LRASQRNDTSRGRTGAFSGASSASEQRLSAPDWQTSRFSICHHHNDSDCTIRARPPHECGRTRSRPRAHASTRPLSELRRANEVQQCQAVRGPGMLSGAFFGVEGFTPSPISFSCSTGSCAALGTQSATVIAETVAPPSADRLWVRTDTLAATVPASQLRWQLRLGQNSPQSSWRPYMPQSLASSNLYG